MMADWSGPLEEHGPVLFEKSCEAIESSRELDFEKGRGVVMAADVESSARDQRHRKRGAPASGT